MASFNGSKQPYSPSAPPEPAPDQPRVAYPYQPPSTSTPSSYAGNTPPLTSSSFGSGPVPPYGPYQPPASSPLSYAPIAPPNSSSSFGPGPIPPPHGQFQPPASSSLTTNYTPHSSSSFGSGHIPPPHGYGYGSYPYQYNQHQQPQQNYSSFPPGTHPDVTRSFQMVDRNQNGYIEETELQEALSRNYQKFSLRTLRLLIFLFKNNRESSSRIGPKEFTEVWSCLCQWRGLTEKLKETDQQYTGSATLTYDAFMSMIIPFLVA